MRLEQSEIFEMNGDTYIVLDTINFDGQNYAFVNKLTEEEISTGEFYIFNSETKERLVNHPYLMQIVKIFEKRLQDEVNEVNKNEQ